MRVLLVSHSYADPGYWDKLDALARRVDLAVVMPTSWQGYLHPASPVPERAPGSPWRQHRLDTLWPGWGFRYLYHPNQLARVLAAERPTIVHVEEEPESLAMLQLSLAKQLYGYRLLFFSWENVNPLSWGWPTRKLAFAAADAGIVGNSAAQERCARLGFRKPLALIPQYGFDVAPRRREELPGGRFVVGYAGRLVYEKGIAQLIDATARLRGVELLVAGSGPLESLLGDYLHVRLLGALPRGEMERFWERIDVLALPSLTTPLWAEQFGRVLVEAMGRGIPVIGSSSGAIPEVIGEAGVIVPEGDREALARAIDRLRENPELREQLARCGIARARRCYSQEVVMDQIVTLYQQVAGQYATA
jgi:glycosyltransferase involved in cell wall biosynthesis